MEARYGIDDLTLTKHSICTSSIVKPKTLGIAYVRK